MKKAKKKQPRNRRKDIHHLFWIKTDYNRGWAKTLRTHWYCRVSIPKETLHRKIHFEVFRVPVPRGENAKQAVAQLNLLEKYGAIHPYDNIEKRLNVLMSLFECCEPETYKALKTQYDIVRKFYQSPR